MNPIKHTPDKVKQATIAGLFQAYVNVPASWRANTSKAEAASSNRPPRKSTLAIAVRVNLF
jgi:hypothetical protein